MKTKSAIKKDTHIDGDVTKETNPCYVGNKSGISRLTLHNFRSYEAVDLKVSPDRPVVLFGKNGAGKTNILEAISMLSPGRGMRSAKLSHMERIEPEKNSKNESRENTKHQKAEKWAVSLEVVDVIGKLKLSTAYMRSNNNSLAIEGKEGVVTGTADKRICKVNLDTMKNQTELTSYLSILWVTPQMDRLFIDSSSSRRKFLDRLVYSLYPDHARLVSKFDNLNRERMRVLKMGKMNDMWLSAIEEQIAGNGVAITASRNDLIEKLSHNQNWALGLFPRGELSLNCEIAKRLISGAPAIEVEEFYKETLRKNRITDQQSGMTNFGAHKADLDVTYKENTKGIAMPAQMCSTGEQKALLLSIVMAAIRMLSSIKKSIPILLLDEVVAHLDQSRRDNLFKEIKNLCIQSWMTGTDCSMFNTLGDYGQFFEVSNSRLQRTEIKDRV